MQVVLAVEQQAGLVYWAELEVKVLMELLALVVRQAAVAALVKTVNQAQQ
jgi:hypothetical protein